MSDATDRRDIPDRRYPRGVLDRHEYEPPDLPNRREKTATTISRARTAAPECPAGRRALRIYP